MLHKKNRLAKDADIARTFARGRGFFNSFFSLKVLSGPGNARFAVVVSTKVFKSAVKRNRLKRLVREYLRKNLDKYKSGNYMLMAKPKISRLPEKDILPALIDVCSRIR